MLQKWVTEHKRSLKTVVMLGLRNDHPYRLISWPFQLTSCFILGHGHHTVRHKGCLVESEATGSVGLNSCGTIQSFYTTTAKLLQWAAALLGLLHALCIKLCRWVYLDSHVFTMGFAVTSQQMWIVFPQYGLCWTVLRGFSGPFNSPPDQTPFTLDKRSTKEKCKFCVRRWVITSRKKDSLIPLGV